MSSNKMCTWFWCFVLTLASQSLSSPRKREEFTMYTRLASIPETPSSASQDLRSTVCTTCLVYIFFAAKVQQYLYNYHAFCLLLFFKYIYYNILVTLHISVLTVVLSTVFFNIIWGFSPFIFNLAEFLSNFYIIKINP